MAKVVNLTQEKLNRSWTELTETWAKLERSHAALEKELRKALLNCAWANLAKKGDPGVLAFGCMRYRGDTDVAMPAGTKVCNPFR